MTCVNLICVSCRYEWTLASDAKSGSMENTQSSLLKLTNLEEGIYTFKVHVSGENPVAYGEAFANVSVFPRKLMMAKCIFGDQE